MWHKHEQINIHSINEYWIHKIIQKIIIKKSVKRHVKYHLLIPIVKKEDLLQSVINWIIYNINSHSISIKPSHINGHKKNVEM